MLLVIDPHLLDSLDFIAWDISVVDENIVWGNPRQNIAGDYTDFSERQFFYKIIFFNRGLH